MSGLLASTAIHRGGFEWTGSYTSIDLIAASTNALNGALLARRPDHYKQFTVVGILLMALLGGLGGGITQAGAGAWLAAGVSFLAGFTVRLLALYRAREEPLATEPKGVYGQAVEMST